MQHTVKYTNIPLRPWSPNSSLGPIASFQLPFLRKLRRRCAKGLEGRLRYTGTSSTAQCGGGSFQNRKPIGEVGCCESRMAGRIHWWNKRWLKLCFLGRLQWLQWSPHPQCSAAVVVVVVVVWCSGLVAVMCNKCSAVALVVVVVVWCS